MLYLSYDGMTDPLGQSQVIPYLTGLSGAGHRFTILSFEKEKRYKESGNEIKNLLGKNKIEWVPALYTKNPPVLSTLFDSWKMKKLAGILFEKNKYDAVHCRSYIAALSGLHLRKKFGVKFLFDMRGFWADERVDGGLWNLNNPVYNFVFRYFKRKEKEMLTEADHIVSLTENGKKEILSWKLENVSSEKVTVIPCCADLGHFNYENTDAEKAYAWKSKLRINDQDKILCYLGSIGTWYLPDEMLLFFNRLRNADTRWKFLFITPEPESLISNLCKRNNVSEENIMVTWCPRHSLPALLSLVHLSVFFIKPAYSKKASSPTKQAEVMGIGIPLVCNSGIGDTDSIVDETNSGIVLKDLTEASFSETVKKIPALLQTDKAMIRNGAENYFSLQKGVEKYNEIYQKLV